MTADRPLYSAPKPSFLTILCAVLNGPIVSPVLLRSCMRVLIVSSGWLHPFAEHVFVSAPLWKTHTQISYQQVDSTSPAVPPAIRCTATFFSFFAAMALVCFYRTRL